MSDSYGYYEIRPPASAPGPEPEPERLGPDPVKISELFGPLLDQLYVRALQHREGEADTADTDEADEEARMRLLNDETLLRSARGDMARLQELIELRLIELQLEKNPNDPYLLRRHAEARKIQESYDQGSD